MTFDLIDKHENSAIFSIHSSNETLKVYPFDFELQIRYSLEENKLNIEYTVLNKTAAKLPFSIGAHPAFALDGNFEDYQLEFEKNEPLEFNLLENNLISNQTEFLEKKEGLVELRHQLFENDALIFKKLESKSISLLKNKIAFLKVHFQGFPHLGIWTPNNAPFLCIEPWYGHSDTNESDGNLFNKEGIQIIDANKTFNSKFIIEII